MGHIAQTSSSRLWGIVLELKYDVGVGAALVSLTIAVGEEDL